MNHLPALGGIDGLNSWSSGADAFFSDSVVVFITFLLTGFILTKDLKIEYSTSK